MTEEEAEDFVKLIPREVKTTFNQRIHREGRTADFTATKMKLRAVDGLSPNHAWIVAALEYNPLDMSLHEFYPWMRGPSISVQPEPQSPPAADEFDPLVETMAEGDAAVEPTPPETSASTATEEPPKRRKKKREGWNKHDDTYKGGAATPERFIDPRKRVMEEPEIAALASKIDPKKKASKKVIQDFVFNNRMTPWSGINPKHVPCRGAIDLLRSVKWDEKVWNDFCNKYGQGKDSSDDEGSRFYDDGRAAELLAKAFESFEYDSENPDRAEEDDGEDDGD